MKTEPLVSIIVNCFNGEKYLKTTLDSIKKQTFKNWELIFWDNKSTDTSAEIFKRYEDKRFKYFYSNNHDLLYEARNKAIKKSQGKLIAFLDTDDWWSETKLEKQVELFNDEKIGLVYSNYFLFYENTKKKKIFDKNNLRSGYITKNLLKKYNVGILTVLIRKTAYENAEGFNKSLDFSGDFDLVIRLSSKWKFASLQEPLAYCRIHDKNYTFTNNLNNNIEIEELERWLSDPKINSDMNIKPHLYYVKQRINFLKTLKNINEGKLFKAIKNIIFLSIGLKKIKLISRIILPNFFINKIKKF